MFVIYMYTISVAIYLCLNKMCYLVYNKHYIMFKIKICIFFVGIILTQVQSKDPDTLAVVINTDTSKLEDFIQIIEPPTEVKKDKLTIEYRCTGDRYVGVEVLSDVDREPAVKVFQKIWKCHNIAETTSTKFKKVKVKLSPEIQYNFNALNKRIQFTNRTKLRAWILDPAWWSSCSTISNCYTRSTVKVSYEVIIKPPFSRPYRHASKNCRTWAWDVLKIATSYKIPHCPLEAETVEVISYPLVLGGQSYGVFRKFDKYKNEVLEKRRLAMLNKPRFTISVWLYILEYCPRPFPGKLCSIMCHTDWKAQYKTVLLFITIEGKLHVEIWNTDGQASAGISHTPLPLHQWIRVVLTFDISTWNLYVNHGNGFNETQHNTYTHPGLPAYMDDTEGLFMFGGTDGRDSFRGYIGQATIYRNQVVHPKQIPYPSQYHPMFELKLTRREEKCKHYIDWVNQRIVEHKERYEVEAPKDVCQIPFIELLKKLKSGQKLPVCIPNSRRHSKHWSVVDRLVKRLVRRQQPINFQYIADKLYNKASGLLDESMENVPMAFPLLKQSACYGNNDAMYVVSVILNHGIYVKADEIQSQAYLMLAALDNHRLSALALGHKHRYGIDGVPLDLDVAYPYFKYVADTTSMDKETHKETDVMTESIRLTDEVAIKEQTEEDGHVFLWLKHQAQQGVISAQHQVGRALFWGSQGLQRNMKAAIEYFKTSAETGNAESQYDYGIVLLRGQGTKKDVKEGLMHLQKAADQKNPAALNAIGWHAMRFDKEYVKAADYFEKAYRMGNPDAAYNLAILYLYGNYPNKPKDVDRAMDYFKFSGTRGHFDGGVAIAFIAIKGTGKQPRDVNLAVEWARYIAEKNPEIGFVLRKGIQAYRKDKRDVSLLYYTMAADAGLEVGSFNMAWLCEENKNGIVSFIEKDCIWRQFNISTQREIQFVDPYSLIKMGDYYWYGCEGHKDVTKAARYYAQAVQKNDPHALFNIGFMLEEGARVPRSVLDDIRIPMEHRVNNVTMLEYIYTRCKESRKSEAYIPCSIALWRVQVLHFWNRHGTLIKIASFTGVTTVMLLSAYVFLRSHWRSPDRLADTIL